MKRGNAQTSLAPEAAAAMRAAFEPRYDHALAASDIGEIADNLRRFHAVLSAWSAVPALQNSAANSPSGSCDEIVRDHHPDVPPCDA